MNKMRILQILGSVAAVGAVLPGAHRAAVHFDAYELVWLIPFAPAFIVTFFWIVAVMVGHFIQADTYKDPRAVRQARSFLTFFEWIFLVVWVLFVCGGIVFYRYFVFQPS